nr:hypothetical protein [uncultured Draconibacterium sp.]
MVQTEIPELIGVSGIYLTKEAIEVIDSFQTGGTLNLENQQNRHTWFSNEFIDKHIMKTDELIRFLIVNFYDGNVASEETAQHLFHLADIVYFLKCFRLPETVLSKSV